MAEIVRLRKCRGCKEGARILNVMTSWPRLEADDVMPPNAGVGQLPKPTQSSAFSEFFSSSTRRRVAAVLRSRDASRPIQRAAGEGTR